MPQFVNDSPMNGFNIFHEKYAVQSEIGNIELIIYEQKKVVSNPAIEIK